MEANLVYYTLLSVQIDAVRTARLGGFTACHGFRLDLLLSDS